MVTKKSVEKGIKHWRKVTKGIEEMSETIAEAYVEESCEETAKAERKRIIKIIENKINLHRKKAVVCCREDCWCWEMEVLKSKIEKEPKAPTKRK